MKLSNYRYVQKCAQTLRHSSLLAKLANSYMQDLDAVYYLACLRAKRNVPLTGANHQRPLTEKHNMITGTGLCMQNSYPRPSYPLLWRRVELGVVPALQHATLHDVYCKYVKLTESQFKSFVDSLPKKPDRNMPSYSSGRLKKDAHYTE